MRLAEKQDDTADKVTPEANAAPPDGKAVVVFAEKPKAPPPATLSASLIPRRTDSSGGIQVEQIEQRAMPAAQVHTSAHPPAQQIIPETPDIVEDPVGARAQQAILEKAFEDLEPVEAISPIERSEFQSARDSAAGWSLRRSPSASYWERVIRDASIFTIFFAVLVLVILQAM